MTESRVSQSLTACFMTRFDVAAPCDSGSASSTYHNTIANNFIADKLITNGSFCSSGIN